ncbi:4'-phosphopantetheinyl transferase family protein [Algibacillus agarilyticus]|uniref:4'-phosphopantetheinyl transferase family protein n=1 Tax=Algibacillus agarilyticus TaxID=2234133 RepID=UPI000DD061AF|nr:4'-phosphopantetheinyl transferase superfamily protein [Algibacillus agarilyticus]
MSQSHPIVANTIEIWQASTEQFDFAHLKASEGHLLNAAEQKKLSEFKFEADQLRYLVTRLFIRKILSHYFSGISPEYWHFKTNAFGKPSIANQKMPFLLPFNLSHTRQQIVCAVSSGVDVGIDIEHVDALREYSDIAARFFSSPESDYIQSLDTEHQRHAFYQIWTLKEAFIKAEGKGLSLPLDQFSFRFDEQNIAYSGKGELAELKEQYQFYHLKSKADHVLSLAVKSTNPFQLIGKSFNSLGFIESVALDIEMSS